MKRSIGKAAWPGFQLVTRQHRQVGMQNLESVMDDGVEHLFIVVELKERDGELMQRLQLGATALDGLEIRNRSSEGTTELLRYGRTV